MKKKLIIAILLNLAILTSQTGVNSLEKHEYAPTPKALFTAISAEHTKPEIPVIINTSSSVQIPSQKPIIPRVEAKPKVVLKSVNTSDPKAYALSRVGETQFACLSKLWNKESGWNYLALNKSSGAYGIPQALPGSKMASAGSDWKTNPITQVKWGLKYINGRYGSSCKAWNFWLSHHWY